jgi:hypothetical protein
MDHYRKQETIGGYQNMAFAPLDLLARIESYRGG